MTAQAVRVKQADLDVWSCHWVCISHWCLVRSASDAALGRLVQRRMILSEGGIGYENDGAVDDEVSAGQIL